ncbi:hypothetical protein TNCV_2623311 [Trichonephila clavipes]|nr:hypothetical protein TNCV_2623311 [Trichonephila clavipes]
MAFTGLEHTPLGWRKQNEEARVGRGQIKLSNFDRSSAIKRLRSTALNSRRAASPLVRLVAGDERWEAPDPSTKLGWDRVKSYRHLYGAQGYGQRQAYI